ncbi:protein SpAN [Strongylocentrotus purpuratus]|uniref:Metalloendopeptidase n=1 Tax=Strongylocentrotus purpuratus TaxID=7668 RepID=A0A7M7PR27_STRPU|nr:protein SpAN [Strongylocentrotus purpuratus]
MKRAFATSVLLTCLVAGILGKPLTKERPMRKLEFNGQVVYVPVAEKLADPFSSTIPGDEQKTDMILNEEQKEYIRQQKEEHKDGRTKRKAVRDVLKRWTKVGGDVIVPFTMDSPTDDVPYIYEAMDHWSTKTCVKFETYSSDRSSTLGHNQRLRFHKADGCWSYVGRQPTNRMQPQPISIGTGCLELGTIAHEIGHAMGFQHEQSRPDRDDHVEVFWTNIETDQQNNFEKESLEDVMASEVVKYDLKSVMHYGPYGFAINENIPTLVTKRPFDMQYIGQRSGLSFYDVKLANYIYNCNSTCDPLLDCANGGFVDKTCTCQCPPAWTGALCNENSNVPETVTETTRTEPSGEITSPGYESGQYSINSASMIYIVGQPGATITLTFDAFDMEALDSGRCWDYVQVNSDDPRYGGEKYCGNQIPDPIVATESIMIWFYSDETNTDKGFRAHFTIDQPLTEAPVETTRAPTTPAVTTTAPTTPAVTTKAPTSPAVTTKAPTTPVVTTEAPTTPVVTTNAPTEAPTTPVVTTNAPTEAPTTPVVTTNAPTEAPTTPVVTTKAPTSEAPLSTLTSPNYPNAYNAKQKKVYRLTTAVGKKIYLKIDEMDIEEGSNGCNYDVLIVDLGGTDEVLQTRLCGTRTNVGPFESVSNKMELTLITDGYVERKGFKASYKSITESTCGGTFGGESGIVESLNYPIHYPNQILCDYVIQVDPGKVIRLTFNDLDVEYGPNYLCQYDCLKVIQLNQNDQEETLLSLDGTSPPSPIVSRTNQLTLRLSSDAYVGGKGFQVSYLAI